MKNKNIWTPFKIWNETQWFSNINSLIDKLNEERKKRLINQFWRRKGKHGKRTRL